MLDRYLLVGEKTVFITFSSMPLISHWGLFVYGGATGQVDTKAGMYYDVFQKMNSYARKPLTFPSETFTYEFLEDLSGDLPIA